MRLRFPVLLAILVWLPSCRSTQTTGRSVFHFDVDGLTYEVVSLSLASGEGVNYLIRRDDGRVVFRARDEDQDGHIDDVMLGEAGIAFADSLYALGIAEAKRRGQFARREPARVYMVTRPTGIATVRSIILGSGDWYNSFTVTDINGSREIFLLDTDADGVLDGTDLDPETMQRWQRMYRELLEEGLLNGRIRRDLAGFIVL